MSNVGDGWIIAKDGSVYGIGLTQADARADALDESGNPFNLDGGGFSFLPATAGLLQFIRDLGGVDLCWSTLPDGRCCTDDEAEDFAERGGGRSPKEV